MTDRNGNPAINIPEENEEEIWLPAPDFEDRYEVSSFGNVRYKKTQRLRSINHDKCGYPILHLKKKINGVTKVFCVYIHRLVCEAFWGAPTPEQNVCDHRDRCIINNYYKNLHWVDYSGNRCNSKPISNRRITLENTPIVFLDLNGHFLYRFDNILQAHNQLGISIQQIQHNIRGVRRPFKDGYFRTEEDYNATL